MHRTICKNSCILIFMIFIFRLFKNSRHMRVRNRKQIGGSIGIYLNYFIFQKINVFCSWMFWIQWREPCSRRCWKMDSLERRALIGSREQITTCDNIQLNPNGNGMTNRKCNFIIRAHVVAGSSFFFSLFLYIRGTQHSARGKWHDIEMSPSSLQQWYTLVMRGMRKFIDYSSSLVCTFLFRFRRFYFLAESHFDTRHYVRTFAAKRLDNVNSLALRIFSGVGMNAFAFPEGHWLDSHFAEFYIQFVAIEMRALPTSLMYRVAAYGKM